LSLGLTMFKA